MSRYPQHGGDNGGYLPGSSQSIASDQMNSESSLLSGLMSNLGIGNEEGSNAWFSQSSQAGSLAWNDDGYSTESSSNVGNTHMSPTSSMPVPQPKRIVPQNMLFTLLDEGDHHSTSDASASDSFFGLGKAATTLPASQSIERLDESGRSWYPPDGHNANLYGNSLELNNSQHSHSATTTHTTTPQSFSEANTPMGQQYAHEGIRHGLFGDHTGSTRAQSTPLFGSMNLNNHNAFGQGPFHQNAGPGLHNGAHNGSLNVPLGNQIPLLQTQMQHSANQFKHLNNMTDVSPQKMLQLRQIQHMQQLQQLQKIHQSQNSVPQLPPNLQPHLVDLDKKMEVRRGKMVAPAQQMPHNAGGYNRQRGPGPGQRPYQTPPPSMEFLYSRQHQHQHQHQHQQMPPSKSLQVNLCGLEDSSVEDIVAKTCSDILIEAANHSLKAVELANTLRARVGTDVLAHVRERWGGLLALLERRHDMFRVERIPKNDLVTLVSTAGATILTSPNTATASNGAEIPLDAMTERNGGDAFHRQVSPRLQESALRNHQQSRTPPLPPDTNGVFEDRSIVQGRVGSRNSVGPSPDPTVSHQQEGLPSRCLHVGNVPGNRNEAELHAEFSQFGEIEGLKVVIQRNRRFAFISFKTLESAVMAKQKMSKNHSWKSAISFAHKESYGTHSGASTPDISDHNHNHHSAPGHGHGLHGGHQRHPTMSGNSISQLQDFGGMVGHNHSMVSPNMKASSLIGADVFTSKMADNSRTTTPSVFGADTGPFVNTYRGEFRAQTSSPNHQLAVYGGHPMGSSHVGMRPTTVSPSLQTQQTWEREDVSGMGPAPKTGAPSNDVLRRLCDDTYVPTQQWPSDPSMDAPYCDAVVSQLKQFGCTTTISKLRGFLRNRLAATDNIKSVPLKAMLAAYPGLFIVQGNQVSLRQPGMQSMPRAPGHSVQPMQPQYHHQRPHMVNDDSISSVAATLGSSAQFSRPLSMDGLNAIGSGSDLTMSLQMQSLQHQNQQHVQLQKLQQRQMEQAYGGAISNPHKQASHKMGMTSNYITQPPGLGPVDSGVGGGTGVGVGVGVGEVGPAQQIKFHAMGGHASSFNFGMNPIPDVLSSDALSTHSDSTTRS